MAGTALPTGLSAHFTVEIHYLDDTVAGQVTWTDSGESESFSSWLDLLRLLETPGRQRPSSADATGPGPGEDSAQPGPDQGRRARHQQR